MIAAEAADEDDPGGRGPPCAAPGRGHLRPRRARHQAPGRARRRPQRQSPIVLGIGESEMFVASDVAALVRYTRRWCTWRTARWRRCTPTDYRTTSLDGRAGVTQASRRCPPRWTPTPTTTSSAPFERLHAQGDPRAAGRAAPGAARPARRAVRDRQARRDQPGRPRAAGHQAGEVPRLRLGLLRRPDGRRCWSRSWPGSRPMPSPRRSSGTATRSSTPTRSTSRSASPARRIDTLMAVQELHRKGGQVIGAVNVGRQRDRPRVRPRRLPARRARRSRSPPPRR